MTDPGPVLPREKGAAMSESTWTKTRNRHLAVIRERGESPAPDTLHVSGNSKTGVSVDFPPHATCTPTAVCMGANGERSAPCYALTGFQGFSAAVRRHAGNLALVNTLETADEAEVERVARALRSALPKGATWLRWNGAGDLTPGSVRLINVFARMFPEITLWVISRKPREMALIEDREGIAILASIDESTPATIAGRLRDAVARFRVARARIAYVRVAEDDTPPHDAWVTFNKHGAGRRNGWAHPSVCHATLPDGPHEGACDGCRRCFE